MPFPFSSRRKVRAVLSVLFALAGTGARPAAAAGMRLIDFGQLGYQSQITVNGASDVATELVEDPHGKALEIRCNSGANANPGIVVRPGAGLKWNLAAYGAVEADVVNLSDVPLVINLRVDNPGDAASRETRGNSDRVTLPVGKSGTVRVYFGYSLGKKAYALEPAKISQLVLFTAKPAKGEATFRVTAVRANGKPGDKPAGTPEEAASAPSPSPSPSPTPVPSASPSAAPSASPSVAPSASPTASPSASATPEASKRAASLPAPPTSDRIAPAAVKRSAERPVDKKPSPSPSTAPDKSASPSPVPAATPEAAAAAMPTVSSTASATPAKKDAVSPSPSPSPTPKKG